MSSSSSLPTDLTFEDAMERLEEILSEMEGENLPLEQMVRSYEEGAGLLHVCKGRIETARQRVELITAQLDAPVQVDLTPFTPVDGPEEVARPVSSSRTPTRKSSPKAEARDEDEIRLF